jgi:uncharacterized damage-inducible protein DinB
VASSIPEIPAMLPIPVRRTSLCVLFLAVVLLAPVALAPAVRADDAVPGLRGELLRSLDDVKSKILDLAQAMPEGKYDWRPGKGVRSVGEVYLHIAQSNYTLPHMAGVEIPADVDVKALATAKFDKAKTIEILTRSFAHADSALANTSDADLDKPCKIFTRGGTVREALLITVAHAHEHLGQSIAYARTNGVVPPWTAKAEADAAAKAKAKEQAKDAKPGDKS